MRIIYQHCSNQSYELLLVDLMLYRLHQFSNLIEFSEYMNYAHRELIGWEH